MKAAACLPQGALILPCFDFDMPDRVWTRLQTDAGSQDHPQYQFAKLTAQLDVDPKAIEPWLTPTATVPARARLLSLALRPAPVTHAWLAEGPQLTGLTEATEGITWLEAEDSGQEALAIALKLREVANTDQTVAGDYPRPQPDPPYRRASGAMAYRPRRQRGNAPVPDPAGAVFVACFGFNHR